MRSNKEQLAVVLERKAVAEAALRKKRKIVGSVMSVVICMSVTALLMVFFPSEPDNMYVDKIKPSIHGGTNSSVSDNTDDVLPEQSAEQSDTVFSEEEAESSCEETAEGSNAESEENNSEKSEYSSAGVPDNDSQEHSTVVDNNGTSTEVEVPAESSDAEDDEATNEEPPDFSWQVSEESETDKSETIDIPFEPEEPLLPSISDGCISTDTAGGESEEEPTEEDSNVVSEESAIPSTPDLSESPWEDISEDAASHPEVPDYSEEMSEVEASEEESEGDPPPMEAPPTAGSDPSYNFLYEGVNHIPSNEFSKNFLEELKALDGNIEYLSASADRSHLGIALQWMLHFTNGYDKLHAVIHIPGTNGYSSFEKALSDKLGFADFKISNSNFSHGQMVDTDKYYCTFTPSTLFLFANSGIDCYYVGSGLESVAEITPENKAGIRAYCELYGDFYIAAP